MSAQIFNLAKVDGNDATITHDHDPNLHTISPIHVSCGDTPETALARNCTFDLLSFSWLPWECYDNTLTSEFLKYNWTWYRLVSPAHGSISPDNLKPVSQEVAFLGNETQLYVSVEYHIVHCIFMWRKLHRGLEMERLHLKPGSTSGAWLDSYVSEFSHTNHCSMFLLDFVDNLGSSKRLPPPDNHQVRTHRAVDEISVTIFTKYPSCYLGPLKEDGIEKQ
ncbi:hypothetical protein CI102_12569 [Trichoderma harzianum]|nr:hypothetical protein CI102_12569 [Trichoderma harzianum]